MLLRIQPLAYSSTRALNCVFSPMATLATLPYGTLDPKVGASWAFGLVGYVPCR